MNRQEVAEKIKNGVELTENERKELAKLLMQKQYGLIWEEKPEAVEEMLRSHLPVLYEVLENAHTDVTKHVANVDALFPTDLPNAPNHILIEGDNLHALTSLAFTYSGKIDVIYIDPPYNRGKNGFKYNDKYIDAEDGFSHSRWLSFMSKRLKIAKELLNETGVMILHIDENEFDTLNLLLKNDIFSEENNLGLIVWNKKNPKGDAKGVATMHEYVLCFAKNKNLFLKQKNALLRHKPSADVMLKKAKNLFSKIGKTLIPEDVKNVLKPFNFDEKELERFKVTYDVELVNKEFQAWLKNQDFSTGEKAYKFIDIKGKVYRGVSMAWPNKEQAPDEYFIPLLHPKTLKYCPIPARGWRNPPRTMQELLDKDLIIFGNNESKQPERKYFLEENMLENTPSVYNFGGSDDSFFQEIGLSFEYPKPIEVAKYFISTIHPNPKLILDFFAGSGTTGHAVMALNAEDGGNRQFILCTNNEVNGIAKKLKEEGKTAEEIEGYGICRSVTLPRLQRVIKGYTKPNGTAVEGLKNNRLRYYRTAYVSRESSLQNKIK